MVQSSSWYTQIPKVELHLHLEGAIPLEALWTLVRKYGGDAVVADIAALRQKFVFRDFPHFIETWIWKNQFLRSYDDFTFIAEAVARDLAGQNILYAETFYSPWEYGEIGLTPQSITTAIRAGLDRVPDVEVALVADLVRDAGPEEAAVTLEQVAEVKSLGVVGIGIGGSEYDAPPEPFAAVYERARALGFHTSAHAGEAAGAESVWGALRVLHAERIGHGTRAEEDPALLDYLVEHQIPLEMCPISNVCTNVVPSLDAHPIRRYFERGILITVNTDDPLMFNNTLAGEYQQLEARLGFNRNDIRQIIANGIHASWLPEDGKARLQARLDEYTPPGS
ncbi:MAG: adenosine deaminase [Anaerolineae bacterium]|nr:adenosine deaminase [Anaerolineae bacterium]